MNEAFHHPGLVERVDEAAKIIAADVANGNDGRIGLPYWDVLTDVQQKCTRVPVDSMRAVETARNLVVLQASGSGSLGAFIMPEDPALCSQTWLKIAFENRAADGWLEALSK